MKGNSLKGEVAEKLVLTFYKLPQTVIMGTISNDIVDFNNKTSLLRLYLGYYDGEDLERLFDTDSVSTILENYTYSQIRARLITTKQSDEDAPYNIGDIVEINKPYMKDGTYQHLLGLIIGKHRVFSEYNNNRTPIYHFSYDILCQLRDYTDGYSYEVRREVSRDLITTNLQSMDSVEGLMKQLALMVIERPL